MLRRLWAGLRAPARNLPSSTVRTRPLSVRYTTDFRSNRGPWNSSWQHGQPHRQHHGPGKTPPRRHLLARFEVPIYGAMFMGLGFLVNNPRLDPDERWVIAWEFVDWVIGPEDADVRRERFFAAGKHLMEEYAWSYVEHDPSGEGLKLRNDSNRPQLVRDHGPVWFPPDSPFRPDEIQTRLLTVPDPDRPQYGAVVLLQAHFVAPFIDEVPEEAAADHLILAAAMLSEVFEKVVSHRNCREIRGALAVADPQGSMLTYYFDGWRWYSISFFGTFPFPCLDDSEIYEEQQEVER
ncbi:hypothetical protein F4780DRAFT_80293 [Xylariomycetidae sp. FL0641]|nr:hypothetical protein F4780DRAFT_80293 [Xylariomycetidae sp. FL0641]